MGIAFIKTSVVYFVIGVGFGLYIGIANQFQFASAHAHINLLGWVSSAIAGLVYLQVPRLGSTKLAKAHFWLYFVGVPILTGAMVLFGLGMHNVGGPLSGVGGILIVVSVLLFAINVFVHLTPSAVRSK